eukprot:TRINITY_DN4235_c0_g1_i2.p1 TRINITY_DN4235_c0_g1~~TRINITY_DN4235_c0_g1_i2.p1  ORF type:complete len:195 (+),score=25.16 TRINITY_DN4235_c0_g1_i2:129-713(+)
MCSKGLARAHSGAMRHGIQAKRLGMNQSEELWAPPGAATGTSSSLVRRMAAAAVLIRRTFSQTALFSSRWRCATVAESLAAKSAVSCARTLPVERARTTAAAAAPQVALARSSGGSCTECCCDGCDGLVCKVHIVMRSADLVDGATRLAQLYPDSWQLKPPQKPAGTLTIHIETSTVLWETHRPSEKTSKIHDD